MIIFDLTTNHPNVIGFLGPLQDTKRAIKLRRGKKIEKKVKRKKEGSIKYKRSYDYSIVVIIDFHNLLFLIPSTHTHKSTSLEAPKGPSELLRLFSCTIGPPNQRPYLN